MCEESFVGNQIRKALKEKGLKHIELCKMVELSPSRLSNYINGRRTPEFQLVAKIAMALGKPLEYFSYTHIGHSGADSGNLRNLAEIIKSTAKPVTVEVITPVGVARLELDNIEFASMLLFQVKERGNAAETC